MKEKSLIIKKASALIQTNAKELTLTQRKIINLFVYIAQKKGDKEEYCIKTSTLKKICGISRKGNDDLKKQLRNLMGIVIEFNYLEKDNEDWEINSLLSSAGISKGSNYTDFEFSKRLKRKILSPKMYVPLNIKLISNLKCTYAIILYEFLKDYFNAPAIPTLTVQQFRELMGISENKYNEFKYLNRSVIKKAINEINEKTDIFCENPIFKKDVESCEISHITFRVYKNKKFKLSNPISIIENNQLSLLEGNKEIPAEILKSLPQKYQINSIYRQIEPYFNDLNFLVSNIEYANKNCDKNYPAYLKLALKNDYAKVNREVKEKKDKIVQDKEDHIQEKKNQEKLLKQKVWDYFNSLPEGEQFEFRSDAEEKMSAALKIVKIPERKIDIINAQIEKDVILFMRGLR